MTTSIPAPSTAPGPVPQAPFDPETATIKGYPLWESASEHTRRMLAAALYVLRSPNHWLAKVIRGIAEHPSSVTPKQLRMLIAFQSLDDNPLNSYGIQAPASEDERSILESLHSLYDKGHWLQTSASIYHACLRAIQGEYGYDKRPQVDWIDVDAANTFDIQLDGAVAALRNYMPLILAEHVGDSADALRDVERGARALAERAKARIAESQPPAEKPLATASEATATARPGAMPNPTEESIQEYMDYERGSRAAEFTEYLSYARAIYRQYPALVTMERMPAALSRCYAATQARTGNPDLDDSRVPHDPFVTKQWEAKKRETVIADLKQDGMLMPNAYPDARLTTKELWELRALALPGGPARMAKTKKPAKPGRKK